MQGTDYRKYKHRVLTDDSRLHLDEINGTLEQTGKNSDGTYNFILTVPTRRYKRPVKKCKRYMFGALGFKRKNNQYKFVLLFGFKNEEERDLFIKLVAPGIHGWIGLNEQLPVELAIRNYNKMVKLSDKDVAEATK